MCQLKSGDRVVSSRALFGSCQYIVAEILPRFGIETELVDGRDLGAWEAALAPGAAAVFMETPSNPTLELIDIEAVCTLARRAGARVVLDNVFASPILQKPIEMGADIVVYSATKHIDGQGRALGGAILATQAFIDDHLTNFMRHTGPSMSPFNAWLMLKGLETLELRMARHCDNARALAAFLEGRGGVSRVFHPSLESHPQAALARRQMRDSGSMVAFEVEGGKARAFRLLNALRTIDISNNLGDSKSLITHPATTTHQRLSPEDRAELGIADSMMRLSVGLEDAEDLKEDLEQALKA
jgi:O-succinylhomoserine sulfhydrylase